MNGWAKRPAYQARRSRLVSDDQEQDRAQDVAVKAMERWSVRRLVMAVAASDGVADAIAAEMGVPHQQRHIRHYKLVHCCRCE